MPQQLGSDDQIARRLRLRDLHLFFAVVQHGSMAKAASHLGITQPTVSEVIGDLEHTLGVRLFDRGPRGVELTTYGNALLTRARAAFDELRQATRDIEFLADPSSGEVRIGCAESASATILPSIISEFCATHPNVALRVTAVPSANWEHSGLRERAHDLLLGWHVTPLPSESLGGDLNVEVLFNDRLIVAAGMQSAWARRRRLDLSELAQATWILGPPGSANYADMTEVFRSRGLAMPKVGLECLSVPLRSHLLGTGRFVAAMLRVDALQSGLKILPVDIKTRPWPFALFTLGNRVLSPTVESFITHIRNFAKTIPGS